MHIEIPEPCHESWQNMTPQEKGRFCDKCCKVVVDFTNMATEKVIDFLNQKKEERVCGRFRTDQIVVPPPQKINPLFAKRAKIFLAALVLVFGGMLFTGCKVHEEKMGKVSNEKFQNFQNETDQPQNYFIGRDELVEPNPVPEKDTITKKNTLKGKVCINQDTVIVQPTGGAILIPDTTEPKLMGKPTVNPK